MLSPDAERALKPGDTFRECAKGCPEMVVVPAGDFMMGLPTNEEGRTNGENPQHKVTIAAPFAVSEFEVTFDEWDTCAAYGDCDPQILDNDFGRGRKPVINVSWYDAQRYAAWLSRMTGKSYRLLSEAEWEYAARAGTKTSYSWGERLASAKPTALAVEASGTASEPLQSGHSQPMHLVYTICTVMLPNGSRIVITPTMTERRQTAWRGLRAAIVLPASSAAVAGTAVRSTSAPPAGARAGPSASPTAWGSGSLGRLPVNFFTLGFVILDHAGLEKTACECFRTIKAEYQRIHRGCNRIRPPHI